MPARSVAVGFLSAVDGSHDAFLDWHEFDHVPENLGRIDHVFHAERFVAHPADLAKRRLPGDGSLRDPGQYLMTYWSTASPEELDRDMTSLREDLARIGRCEPIDRDFRVIWGQKMQLVLGRSNPRHHLSPAAAFLSNHDAVVVTVGCRRDDSQWTDWYADSGLDELFQDPHITAAYVLAPPGGHEDEPFIHLHYLSLNRDSEAQVAAAYRCGPEGRPLIIYQATYRPQRAGQPRFYR